MIVNKNVSVLFLVALLLFFGACASPSQLAKDVRKTEGEGGRLTVGTVQKDIHIGMSGADVAAALGSPNIVTTDEKRREAWIYDRLSTESVSSSSQGGWTIIFAGSSGGSKVASRTQKTLTIVVKFDEQKLVRDFAYHTSRF